MIWFAFYIVCIVLANWLVAMHPPITVWPTSLIAPAGVYMAGFTFMFRNLTQQSKGRRWGFAAIAVGAFLSATIFQSNVNLGGPLLLPVASGLTFFLSEAADATVWTWLRQKQWWLRAGFFGEIAGQVLDSIVFLTLAFGSFELLAGQILGKWYTLIPAMILMWVLKRYGFLARHASTQLA